VGNWPGKTVAKKEGLFKHNGLTIKIIDLPGTYSLSAHSPEEQIARDFIVDERPAAVINVLDAANLERNLYLTAQILETGAPVIVLLNMMDLATDRRLEIDTRKMSQELGLPVITTVASQGRGLDELKQSIIKMVRETSEKQETTGG